MAEINKPDFQYIWASGGSNVSPSNTKIQTGWTAEVPPFQWENWSQNRQDQAIAHVLQHGISVWDAVTEYQAGKSYVQGSDGLLYKARTTHTNVNPVTDTSFVNWTKALSGGLLNVQVFPASGTYTPTPGTTSVVVDLVGGGGGGGGVPATGVGALSIAGGGGGGSRATARFLTGFSGAVVTVGAAGAAGAIGATGGTGGQTSFGGLLSATGGTGGSSASGPNTSPFGAVGGSGGTLPTLGNILNMGGQAGGSGAAYGVASFISGSGANSCLGGGGPQGNPVSTAPGGAAKGVGAGGAGATNGASSAGQIGGVGGSGLVIVYEYI